MRLSDAQSRVTEFHQLIRAPIADRMNTLSCDRELSREVGATLRSLADRCRAPTATKAALSIRLGLALEELAEWIEANLKGDLTAAADALGDRLYVLLGDAVSVGVPIEPVFAAVHQSNMTKAAQRSQANGKGVKSAEYRAPDLSWLAEIGIQRTPRQTVSHVLIQAPQQHVGDETDPRGGDR